MSLQATVFNADSTSKCQLTEFMINAKSEEGKILENLPLVRKVAITDTLKLIPCGKTARYSCKDMPLLSIYSAVSRLNKAAGREEYRVSRVIDGGAGCEITRK